ncbi:hypothetical protein BYT27DRAFT_7198051 [Phlegmacium glaucopus]|nr:hypothetical protein BYT27DRAFT_7198051 [Phlegmacium glaucopus]
MGNETLFAGLKLRHSEVVWKWDKLAQTRPNESLVYVWHLFQLLPFKWLLYDKPGNTWWPHVWEGRVIKPGQKIHASVSFIKDYKSKAKFSPGMVDGDWSSVVNKGRQDDISWMKGIENLLELDLFDYSNVKKIIDDGDVARLEFVALTREGRQAIADEIKFFRNMLEDSNEGESRCLYGDTVETSYSRCCQVGNYGDKFAPTHEE